MGDLAGSGWYHFVRSSKHFQGKKWVSEAQYQQLQEIAAKVAKEIGAENERSEREIE